MTTFMFWNLYEAGKELRRGDDAHWQQQVAIVNNHRPQVLAITEGWEWERDDHALLHRAQVDFGMDGSVFYESKTGCHMAVFWRDGIKLLNARRQPQQEAFWHGFLRADLALPDADQPFSLLVSHLNPFDPTLRRIEGSWLRQQMRATGHGALVMDANCIAPGDPEPPPSPTRNQVGEDNCDRTPLQGLADIGLVDVGASRDDRRPTFGYYRSAQHVTRGDTRLDQAWATPSVTITDYRVLDSADVDPAIDSASDHRPIWFETGK